VPAATIRKFNDDQAANSAVVIAFYGFFSVFPLLLALMTVLGYVLAGDASARDAVEKTVLGNFPVIGDTIKHDKLKGSGPALGIGVVLSIWSGLGVTGAVRNAFDHVWGVPRKEREGFVQSKLHGLALLIVLGVLFVVTSGASGLVSGGLGGPVLLVFGILASILLNIGLFLASFKLLCSEDIAWGKLLPGALVASVLWEVLQVAAGVYIGRFDHSNNPYGTFALVLGVLAWLHLGSQMMVYCAEFNTVLAKKAWPRSLLGDPEPVNDS
jgi:membrane protein